MTDFATTGEAARDEHDFGAAFSRAPETVAERFQRLRGPQQLLREGDRASLRDHLVMEHRWLVSQCARAFAGGDEPLEDLIQEGTIGLIKAVDRFDPDKGVRFSTYAGHLILGEMRHYLRDLGKMIHEPGWHAQLRVQVMRATDNLAQKLGRAPELDEIAASMSVPPQTVARVLESQNLLSVASLDVDDENADGVTRSEMRLLESDGEQPISTQVENHLALGEAIGQLRDLEQRAVSLFFYEDCSKTEIARRLGISVNYAAYLVKRGVEHLRLLIEPDEAVKSAPRAPKIVAPIAPVRWDDALDWIARHRTGKTEATFSLMLLRIRNWNEATAQLSVEQKAQARVAAIELARRCCRKTDHAVEILNAPSNGLALLALMPKTAIARFNPQAISPHASKLRNPPLHEYSYATHPDHGSDVSQLLSSLIVG